MTERSGGWNGVTWRYCQDAGLPFDPLVFDENQLALRQLVTGHAGAGRGNTVFFTYHDHALVLRHYRRGGLAQRLTRRHYLYTGIERTRAMREFAVLVKLDQQQLPVSRPYACRIVHQGLFYRASLITHRLPGCTLAEALAVKADSVLEPATWSRIGEVVGRMHAAGVHHADLNAHNIMIDEQGAVYLIDFDRAQPRQLPAGRVDGSWCLSNIERLRRSLVKVTNDGLQARQGYATLKKKWQETLTQSLSPHQVCNR